MVEWIAGSMLWVNLNSEKTTEWRKYLRTTRSADLVFQTYVIHNTKDSRRTESDCWWKYQSNVHGVVIAAIDVPKGTVHSYPQTVVWSMGEKEPYMHTVIEHFIPGLLVAESDFKKAERIDIMHYLGRDKKIFFQALQIGVRHLRKHFSSSKQRTELRYAGRSYDLVAAAFAQCDEVATDAEDTEDMN